jgi:hypothetical protein
MSVTIRKEHRLRVFENSVSRKMIGLRRDEQTIDWRKFHNYEFHGLYPSPTIIRAIKNYEMGKTYITQDGNKKCIQSFGWKTLGEEITWDTLV